MTMTTMMMVVVVVVNGWVCWNVRRKNCWKASSSSCSRRSTSRSSTCAFFRTCDRRSWLIYRTRTSRWTSTSNSTTWTSTQAASRSNPIRHDDPKSNYMSRDYITSSSLSPSFIIIICRRKFGLVLNYLDPLLHSWDNKGYPKNLDSPWICHAPFSPKIFNGLWFGWTLWIMFRPNLKSVASPVPEIIAIGVLGGGCEPHLREEQAVWVCGWYRSKERWPSKVTFLLFLRVSEILPLLCSSTPLFPTHL